MGFISKQGLEALKDYRYKSGGYTKLDNFMNPFWQWVVKQVPMNIAPNLITFVGWIFVILSYVTMLVYDYTFQKQIPSFCFIFAAICIFVYSTLDSIDGKQARRTKSSSALGQLFDHGCDSFSISFFILAVCEATLLQQHEVFLLFVSSQMSFWMANWVQYNTGILNTKVGEFGVTQAQFTCMIIHIITGMFGQQIWGITVATILPKSFLQLYPKLEYIQSIRMGSIAVYFYSTLLIIISLYALIQTLIKNNQRIKIISQFLTLIIVILMQIIWNNLTIYKLYNGLILVNFGIIQSLIICKMIICSVTKMKFQYFHNQIIVFIISTIVMIGLDLRHNLHAQIIVYWITFLINLIMIIHFLYSAINQLTDNLGIYCFSLRKKNLDSLKKNN